MGLSEHGLPEERVIFQHQLVIQQHAGAGHAVYHTWGGGSVEALEGAETTHPGLAVGPAIAGAGGAHTGHSTGAAVSDAAGGTSSRKPTTPARAAGAMWTPTTPSLALVLGGKPLRDYEADPNDYDEYLRTGGYSDVDPNEPRAAAMAVCPVLLAVAAICHCSALLPPMKAGPLPDASLGGPKERARVM
ncbi:hypothetical protein CYMTET_6047 [Cymbomonas tetramitiformis]|uniref:Uncharacterized protein n=1 Tax=Cymbomonas tetramitiformis TaxID=36881 RepID=A0AAE0LIA3_9CHLO|nr:hypothetical protein CYMTET_6047 [Cymbomonas tetramitiformis]